MRRALHRNAGPPGALQAANAAPTRVYSLSVTLPLSTVEGSWLLVFFVPFVGLGAMVDRWRVVIGLLAAYGAIALFLLANNGWYGAGWGEFGVELNLIIAGLGLFGILLGVAIAKAAGNVRD